MNVEVHKTVEQLIKKNKRKNTDIEIKNLQTNKDGFNNNIAMFHLTYFHDEGVFSNNVVLKEFSGNLMLSKELTLLRSNAVNSCINTPTVYFVDIDMGIMLMEYVKGDTLDRYITSNSADRGLAFGKFGTTLAHIHSISTEEDHDDIDLRHKNDIHFYLESLKNRVSKFENSIYVNCLQNISKKFRDVSFTEALNHGDYHFGNTIITNENKLYILDWEKAFIGDPRFDIANSLTLGYSWFGLCFKEIMVDAYQSIINKKIEHLECFEALSSFDSFTKVVPLIQGADDSHIRDRSFEWLKRRYELFVKHNGTRINEAEEYLLSKGLPLSIL
ncbi:aminoglycoside phosphotransferase family protein [Rossellomorea sp. SC111]|uniref:aminoglycoside phosphotransferase family protein n=1 Tax=Rossellomorea sp. SC111 TaxID=2968985 RepID=UPI00215AA899|nr:aminoglycoside phosphotransferase family protein [Rossellomorea sp. SC111]MCR8848407.1 aminoglycoside phosphotransferase family protein [Rossellomorea sp. SC111]